MPPKKNVKNPGATSEPQKRKYPPQSFSSSQNVAGNGRAVKRVKTVDARPILTQPSDTAVKNGELDLLSFLKSREFEIKALQDAMERSKSSRTTRAFQQVPRDMRRRTASHNVKRVPKRLQRRAAKEMKDDNTPTVTPSKRKPGSSRGRVRAETAKRLGILAEKKRAMKAKSKDEAAGIETRAARPKIRKDKLNDPPKPKSKFRKRQIHKTWLPTHMWHAKRATMTEPKKPLWRFSIPIKSTEKSYRPTHRATGARGAVAWDLSYMSTICLEGPSTSLEKVLKAVGVTTQTLWTQKGEKWRHGKRSWNGWLSRVTKDKTLQICPSTVLWCPSEQSDTVEAPNNSKKPIIHRVFVRVHPAAFLETWTELLRLSKLQRPAVHVEDLRFEIGSIEIYGPGSTEALLGILHPYHLSEDSQEEHAKAFTSLAGLTNPGSLPSNALLSFSVMDPRLRYPPRSASLPKTGDEDVNFALLEKLSSWHVDTSIGSSALFDRDCRFKATHLPAQKSLNRRKALAPPGTYPPVKETDPPIPIILLASRSTSSPSAQGSWQLLAPWKCILPIWYGLMHYPLSSGGNPRFGGLQEIRQIHFEQGVPWFPADFPGTSAGFAWEVDERLRRKSEWDKRPKGKRVEWDSLDLGGGRKGEVGLGWACDFERLIVSTSLPGNIEPLDHSEDTQKSTELLPKIATIPLQHLSKVDFVALLAASENEPPPPFAIANIHITLVSRGIATPCARIYRLPRSSSAPDSSTNSSPSPTTGEQWLNLFRRTFNSKPLLNNKSKTAKSLGRIPLNTPLPQRVRLLAQSLLQEPPLSYPGDKNEGNDYPVVPDEDDLIGFVTTGEFNLVEGKGVAIGSVVVTKVLEGLRRDGKKAAKEGRLCIVRNAGEKFGRLGRWEAV
jgi:ribonuclease P/MRP protein subunit POP1